MRQVHPHWSFDFLLDYFSTRREVLETEVLKDLFPGEDPFGTGLSLDLFEKHFLLYRRLYLFADELLVTDWRLSIANIRIKLLDEEQARREGLWDVPEGGETALAEAQLRGYYLNWDNLHTMTQDKLEDMVDKTWARIFGQPDLAEIERAAGVLGVSAEASAGEVRRRYRELCHVHHPDHGGSTEGFDALRQAYAVLVSAARP